jgi:hypothetical protein
LFRKRREGRREGGRKRGRAFLTESTYENENIALSKHEGTDQGAIGSAPCLDGFWSVVSVYCTPFDLRVSRAMFFGFWFFFEEGKLKMKSF